MHCYRNSGSNTKLDTEQPPGPPKPKQQPFFPANQSDIWGQARDSTQPPFQAAGIEGSWELPSAMPSITTGHKTSMVSAGKNPVFLGCFQHVKQPWGQVPPDPWANGGHSFPTIPGQGTPAACPWTCKDLPELLSAINNLMGSDCVGEVPPRVTVGTLTRAQSQLAVPKDALCTKGCSHIVPASQTQSYCPPWSPQSA